MFDYNQEEILRTWSVKKEQQKADFMEHLFDVYKPSNNCYTGLWQRFCMGEAGDYCRDMYFERLAALEEYLKTVNKNQPTSATTNHD
jgi:hypothetical protein